MEENNNPLEMERQRATFPIQEMNLLLNNNKTFPDRDKIIKLLREDAALQQLRDNEPFNNKTQNMKDMMLKTKRIQEILARDFPELRGSLARLANKANLTYDYAFPPFNSTLLSAGGNGMFINVIRSQMTPEQSKKWLLPAIKGEIWGTYAQTEMGHGSNVRGLETTGTYDPSTKEFIIHSPTLSSTKWWPAHLGFGCTHAVVYARLIVDDVDRGVVPFMVQLRDTKTYEPLPGVQLGTSGPTIGHYANEHGRCRFNNVRIPRDQLCMRWHQVSPDGTYFAPKKEAKKTSYITMTNTRVGFVTTAYKNLSKALTIGVRYSCCRKQGFPAPGVPEQKIMDYGMQQHIMLTLLSCSYALKFTSLYVVNFSSKAMAQLDANRTESFLTQMPELHATTSGLKALSTKLACEGIEVIRKACGGHGYGLFSGLPQLYLNTLRSQTVEGDNNVLCLQTSRFLVKAIEEAKSNGGVNLSPILAYLKRDFTGNKAHCSVKNGYDWRNRDVQLNCFGHWALREVSTATENYLKGQETMPEYQSKNENMYELVQMAYTHSYFSILTSFAGAIENYKESNTMNSDVLRVMERLCDLFALSTLQQNIGGITMDGFVDQQQVMLLNQEVKSLMNEIRPDAVALVDSFGFDDILELHQTAIGRYDGNYTKHLWEWSQKDPNNNAKGNKKTGDFPPEFDENWGPVLSYFRRNAGSL